MTRDDLASIVIHVEEAPANVRLLVAGLAMCADLAASRDWVRGLTLRLIRDDEHAEHDLRKAS